MDNRASSLSRRAPRAPKRKNLGDVVYDQLISSIKSGAYQEDERLPTEHELAAEFEVSRPVVREALQRLRDKGLIYSRRGAGSFVRSGGLKEPLGFGQLESIAGLAHCFEFRITFEPKAAALAANRHAPGDLLRIKEALDQMRDATARKRHRDDADFNFHSAIAKASGNPYFGTAMEALKEHIAYGMRFHGMSLKRSTNGLAVVCEEHTAIYEAIREHRACDARELMETHLTHSRDRLFEGDADPLGDG